MGPEHRDTRGLGFRPLRTDRTGEYRGSHWVEIVAFIKEKCVIVFDSLAPEGARLVGDALKYRDGMLLFLESQASERDVPFNARDWAMPDSVSCTPQQRNHSDCGVMACMCAAAIGKRLPLNYSAVEGPTYRKRIALALAAGSLPI